MTQSDLVLETTVRFGKRFWLAVAALTVLALALPLYAIWSHTYVPAADFSNHMAVHYLEYLKLTGRELPPFYAIEYRVTPNLGGDLLVPLFLCFLAPLAACKAFLTFAVFLYWLGPSLFIWQQGGRRRGAFVAALFWLPWLLSNEFFWGFASYYSGFGLAFLVLTHHCIVRTSRSGWIAHQLLQAAMVALLFLWHLSPWGIYCVIVGCRCLALAVADYGRSRAIGPCLARAVSDLLPVVPSLLLLGWYFGHHLGTGEPVIFQLSAWTEKARFASQLFGGYDKKSSALVLLIWGVAALSTFGFSFLFAKSARWTWLHLAFAALTLLYLVLPNNFIGGGCDTRLLPAILVVALACIGSLPIRRLALGVALIAACVVLRDGEIVRAWDRICARLDSHAQSFALIEPRSRVMPVTLTPVDYAYPDAQFISWAAVFREAFVPTLFARRDQHTLRLIPPSGIYVRKASGHYEFDEGPVRESYDYVWLYNPDQEVVQIPRGWQCLFSADDVTLWRVNGSGAATGPASSGSQPGK